MPEKSQKKPVPVLVEMRVQRGTTAAFAVQLAANAKTPGFMIDREFDAIPMQPSPDQAASLAESGEEVVIVRGTVDEDKIKDLEAQPNVVKVWRDTPIAPFTTRRAVEEKTAHLMPTAPMGVCPIPPCDCSFGNPAIGAIASVATYLGVDKIWAAGIKGAGIRIGIVDGGITAIGRPVKPGEVAKVARVVDGWPGDWGTTAIAWGNHGNMTSTDALGMAPQAEIYDIRISSATLAGSISSALQGFQWAINRHKIDGTPQVLSNSWGIFQKTWDPVYAVDPNHPFTRKVVEALDEGILVLFAAGNCGQVCPDGRCGPDNGPGKSIWGANSHPRVITVGAVNVNEQWVGYSSQGPGALDPNKPDFCSITHFAGYFPTLDPAHPSDGGTSAATPICAGVVALLKQKKPALTQDQAKTALKSTAKDIGPAGWDQHSGAGIIRAKGAYDSLAPKLKFRDDHGTLKFTDDHVTLKFTDDGGTLKFADDGGTLKFADDGGKLKFRDDVKVPARDIMPDPRGPRILPPISSAGVPFILATPHHSMAWAYGAAEQAMQPTAADYEAAIAQYEATLASMEQAIQETLRQAEALDVQYKQLVKEHQATVEEYTAMTGGS